MSKSGKKGRGKMQTVSLGDFTGTATAGGDDLEWAKDQFQPTPPLGPQDGPGEVPKMGAERKRFDFAVGAMDGNFRDMDRMVPDTVVPEDMKAPFVAYVGNLPNKMGEETLQGYFPTSSEVRIIPKDKGSFAYVEFPDRETLQQAILTTGQIIGGRKVRVDVASQQQRDRLQQERNRASGSPTSAGPAFGGRDAMGNTPPPAGGRGMPARMGSRGASMGDLAFDRDAMGSTEQPAQPRDMSRGGFASSGFSSPTTGGAPEFSRDSFGETKQKSPNSAAGAGGRFGFRNSKPSSPAVRDPGALRAGDGPTPREKAAGPDFGSWRTSSNAEESTEASAPAPAKSPAASPVTQQQQQPPKERPNAWGRKPEATPAAGGGWRD